jgi:hypothetical protein
LPTRAISPDIGGEQPVGHRPAGSIDQIDAVAVAGDADRGDVAARQARLGEDGVDDLADRPPQRLGIALGVAGSGRQRTEGAARHAELLAGQRIGRRLDGGAAGVDAEDEVGHGSSH